MGDTSEHFSEPRCATGSMYPIYPGVHVGIVSHTEDIARHQQRIKFAEEEIKKIQATCAHQFVHKDAEQRRVAETLPAILIKQSNLTGGRSSVHQIIPVEFFSVRCKLCWLEADLVISEYCPKCVTTMSAVSTGDKSLQHSLTELEERFKGFWEHLAFRCTNVECGLLVIYQPPVIRDER